MSLSYFVFVFVFEMLVAIKGPKKRAFGFSSVLFSAERVGNPNKLFYLAMGVLGLYVFLLFFYLGSFSQIFYAFSVRVSGAVSLPVYFTLLPDLFVVIVLFFFYISETSKNNTKLKTKSYFLIVLCILMLALSGARGNLIQFLISMLMIKMTMTYGRVYFNKNILILGVSVVLILFVGLSHRLSTQNVGLSFEESIKEASGSFTNTLLGPFALYDHYGLSKIYTVETGYDYGYSYTTNLVRPIPRSLWKDKPQALGKKIRYHFWGDELGGVPPGLIGEYYISAGVFGLLFLMPLFTAFVFMFNNMYVNSLKDKKYLLFVSMLTPYLFYSVIRLGVDVSFTRIVIFVFFFFLVKKIAFLKIRF